jgi:hypothetical protein
MHGPHAVSDALVHVVPVENHPTGDERIHVGGSCLLVASPPHVVMPVVIGEKENNVRLEPEGRRDWWRWWRWWRWR